MNILSFKADGKDPLIFNPHVENILVLIKVPEKEMTTYNLTEEEHLQAQKFYHSTDRHSYLWRHHLLNSLLSHYTNKPVAQLNLLSVKSGKKSLPGFPFHFNISKSSGYIALAFGPYALGVDIELLKDIKPFMPVADQHFHPEEKIMLQEDLSPGTFFSIWTRKEALLKANGSGVNDELNIIDTTAERYFIKSKEYQLITLNDTKVMLSFAYENNEEIPLRICNYNII